MSLQVALLRGVNLGKRQVVMRELRAVCETVGFRNVRTLAASGNLVLEARHRGAALEKELEAVILEELGLKTNVFVRTGAELNSLIAANPLKAFAKAHPNFMVAFFMRAPANEAELEAAYKSRAKEELRQGEGCLYVKYPDGQGRSKLKLPSMGTARNWNTVTKLAAMAAAE